MSPAVIILAVVVVAVAGAAATYGRWAGWGFGLGWWGRPTPAQVRSVEPLTGALMKGGAPWAVREARHRVRADLEVQPGDSAPYEAAAITWLAANAPLAGRRVIVRVSRTRPRRVHLSAVAAAASTDPDPPGTGRY